MTEDWGVPRMTTENKAEIRRAIEAAKYREPIPAEAPEVEAKPALLVQDGSNPYRKVRRHKPEGTLP